MGKRKGPLAATKKKGGLSTGDFKKRIAKVGKRAAKQANVTKVNVKSKQLYMPTQRLAAASTSSGGDGGGGVPPGQERTAKGQTLAELLHQARHHNEGARIGAVQGLKELVTSHPGLGQREMAGLLDGGLELLLDPEDEVRRASLGLLRTLLLPSAGAASTRDSNSTHRASLLPFAPLAATYLCAALSHLDQSIRRDGLAYLDLLVQSLGPHLLPHAHDILPSLAALLDRPPHPSKRRAARLLAQQKQQQQLLQAAAGGPEDKASPKEKDQQLKARMELWAARAAVLRCTLGLTRLLPQQVVGAATAAAAAAPPSSSSVPVTVEWGRGAFVLLLRPTEEAMVDTTHEEAAMAVVEEEDSGEALAALLPRVKNYVLELSTASSGSGSNAATTKTTTAEADAPEGGSEQQQEQQPASQQERHQVEAGPALDALAGAIEFALVALQCLASASSSTAAAEGQGPSAASGEMQGLVKALVGLFPLQLADGATAVRTSFQEEEEGEEEDGGGGGVVTEDGLNLALVEVAFLNGATVPSSSRRGKEDGAPVDARVVDWLVGLMDRRAHALGGMGTAEGERLGARLLRLLRALLPSLYAGGRKGEQELAERLLRRLEACTQAWPPTSVNKRAALRLLCDLLPRRPPPAARAWLERTARTELPQWTAAAAAGVGGSAGLAAPVLTLLLKDAAVGGGSAHAWLPDVVAVPLEPKALAALAPEVRLRACDLLYHCPALPPALQEAVVAVAHAEGMWGGGAALLDYLVEILHHRRQLLTPSAYLTLLGRLLTLPASTPLPYAATVASAVGRALRQLQQSPGALLNLIEPLLESLLTSEGSAIAARRQAALVVVQLLGEAEEGPVLLPAKLATRVVAMALGQGCADGEEEEKEGGEATDAAAFAAAAKPLLLVLLRRHGRQLLPSLVETVTPSVGDASSAAAAASVTRIQEWLREPGLNWAPAKQALVEFRRRCVEGGPRLQGLVHDLDLLPLGLGK